MKKINYRLIYDRDHGPENYGWYTRHDEVGNNGDAVNIAVDEACFGDADQSQADALAEAVEKFDCSPDEIEICE